MKTVLDWQQKGVEILKKDEVDYILSGILGLSRTELYLRSGSEVDEEKGREISHALKKRISGMPLQYILGEVEFFSLPFYVTRGVFIPRPETEFLVEEALKINSKNREDSIFGTHFSAPAILDLCTGCGNIALSLAKNIPGVKIIATDISGLSLKVARENAIRLGMLDRVKFLQGDLFGAFRGRFSLIISNPPYISVSEWESLPGEVKYYEPHEALFGGEAGLDFYKRISYDARFYIKEGGHLLLEVGHAREVASILKQDGWQDIRVMKDYNSLERIISCKWIR